MFKYLSILAAFLASACATAPVERVTDATGASDDATQSVQVMVLGTFHMANPGQDVANVEVENMLTDQRQAEIAAVAEALAEFNPTVVAVERITEPPAYVDPHYADYTPAQLRENPNERVQIGYRLAGLAGVARVYGIDEQPSEGEPDYFPFGELAAHAEATGQGEAFQQQITDIQKIVAEFSALQKDHNVAELLIEQNTPESVEINSGFYYSTFVYDRGEAQPGAELQAYWFMRNAKIFSKLMQVTEPGDRVVVVYGAGHKFWLDHLAEHTPGYVRVDPLPYLEKAAGQ